MNTLVLTIGPIPSPESFVETLPYNKYPTILIYGDIIMWFIYRAGNVNINHDGFVYSFAVRHRVNHCQVLPGSHTFVSLCQDPISLYLTIGYF